MRTAFQRFHFLASRLVNAPLWQAPWVALGASLVAVGIGWGVLWWSTAQWGPGANSDGLSYLILARSLYRGLGYGYPQFGGGIKPMTHFPPGYPWAISRLMLFTRGDEVQAALLVNGLSLAALVLLAAWAMFRVTHHAFPTAGLAAWLAIALPTYRIYAYVFSETLFLPTLFLVAWALQRWQERPHPSRGFLVGLLAGWLAYIRWIGLLAIGWVILDTLLAHARQRWQTTARRLGYAIAGWGLSVGALLLANHLRSGSATNRRWLWHPPTAEKWRQALETLWVWTDPITQKFLPHERAGWLAALLYLLGLAAIAWALRKAPSSPERPRMLAVFRRWGLFILLYFAAVVAAITFLDAATPLDWRLLAPLFPALSLMIGLGTWMALRRHPSLVLLASLLWGALLYSGLKYDKWSLIYPHLHGDLLRHARWQRATLWPKVRALPPEVHLLTPELEEVIYYADRPANLLFLPEVAQGTAYIYDASTGETIALPYQSLEEWAVRLNHQLANTTQCTVIVYPTVENLIEQQADPLALERQRVLRNTLTPYYQDETGMILLPSTSAACQRLFP